MKYLPVQLIFVLAFVCVIAYGMSFAETQNPELVIYNQDTHTKIALVYSSGRMVAIDGNEDIVIFGQVLVDSYSVKFDDLSANQKKMIHSPSVVLL